MSDKTRMGDPVSPGKKANTSSEESTENNQHVESEEVRNESIKQIPTQETTLLEEKQCSLIARLDADTSTSQIRSFPADQSFHIEELSFEELSFEEHTSEELSSFDLISTSNEHLDDSLVLDDPSIFNENFWDQCEKSSLQESQEATISAAALYNALSSIQMHHCVEDSELPEKHFITLDETQQKLEEFREQAEAKLVITEIWDDIFNTFWTFNGEHEPEEFDSSVKQWIESIQNSESNENLEDDNTRLQDISSVINELQELEDKIFEQEFCLNMRQQRENTRQNKKIENIKWQKKCEKKWLFNEKRKESERAFTLEIQSNELKKIKFNSNIETPIATSSKIEQRSNIDSNKRKSFDNNLLKWQLRFKNHFSIIEKRKLVHDNAIKEKWNYDYQIRCNMQLKPAISLTPILENNLSIPIPKQEIDNSKIYNSRKANELEWKNRFERQCLPYNMSYLAEETILKQQWKHDIQLRRDIQLVPAMELSDKSSNIKEYSAKSNKSAISNIYKAKNEQIDLIPPIQNTRPDTNVSSTSSTLQTLSQNVWWPANTDITNTSMTQSLQSIDNNALSPYTNAEFQFFQEDITSFEQFENDAYDIEMQRFITEQMHEAQKPVEQYKEIEKKIMNTIRTSMLHINPLISNDENIIYFHMLSEDNEEYSKICKRFHMTTEKIYTITRIANIINPYLNVGYSLRKLEYIAAYGKENVHDMVVFRGLKRGRDAKSIMVHNWNWRCYVKSDHQPFGKGVTFASMAKHALKDCDDDGEKMMASALIIVTEADFDENVVEIREPVNQIFSKFRDDEYCPKYVVYFI
ncbi:uncharacterized protein LOC143910552 [Arctopsyche grandis]|uniref:uncharacterized protein LOC143910552 n=1 Tax=Arctopsyche grandis TaxID=121162 RepID=UPI00406D8DA6